MPHNVALPTIYYAIFGIFEPILTVVGFFGTVANPKVVRCLKPENEISSDLLGQAHDNQAPWPNDIPPTEPLPQATLVSIVQLAHVCGLLGVLNFFILRAVRKHLRDQPAVQEKIVAALLMPLAFADVFHLVITLWALGDSRWDCRRWSGLLWSTVLFGLSLLIPRIAWNLGIGRYVHTRDGRPGKRV